MLLVTGSNLGDEQLQQTLVASHGSEHQQFAALRRPPASIFAAIEVDADGTAAIPEPMASRRRNQREVLVAHRGVEINTANALEKLLLGEPLLHPGECCILVLHGD